MLQAWPYLCSRALIRLSWVERWLSPQVYNVSGLLPLQQQLRAMGPEYNNAASWTSYQLCPRASIFRRNFSDVVDVESMKHLMHSNDYATDKVCCLLGRRQAEADIYAALQAASEHYQLDIIMTYHPQHPVAVKNLQCAAGGDCFTSNPGGSRAAAHCEITHALQCEAPSEQAIVTGSKCMLPQGSSRPGWGCVVVLGEPCGGGVRAGGPGERGRSSLRLL